MLLGLALRGGWRIEVLSGLCSGLGGALGQARVAAVVSPGAARWRERCLLLFQGPYGTGPCWRLKPSAGHMTY